MKKIYDISTQRACVYVNVESSSITLDSLSELIKEIKNDHPFDGDIQVHHFELPEYSFTGFGVSIFSKIISYKYREVNGWFH